MSWHDEIPRLFRHPIEEIGVAFYIREKMRNDWIATREDLRLTFGQNWNTLVENLRRDGILKRKEDGGTIRLSVIAPGDKKRERCRIIGLKKRKITKLRKKRECIGVYGHWHI